MYAKTLTADSIDVVGFAGSVEEVEVLSDGSAAIYLTVDGSDPSVAGGDCYELPALPCTRVIPVRNYESVTVKLISAGTPMYSVCQLASGGLRLGGGGDIDGGTP